MREFNPRGANQAFNREGARFPNTNGRGNNTYNDRQRGMIGNNSRGDSRWSQNDRPRGQMTNGPNHRVNMIGIERDHNNGRVPYWMINNRGRGYPNPRQNFRRRHERGMRNNQPEIDVVEARRESRRRSPSPTNRIQQIDNPVERLLAEQNARGVAAREDRRQEIIVNHLNE